MAWWTRLGPRNQASGLSRDKGAGIRQTTGVRRIRAIAVIVATCIWSGGEGSQLHAGQTGPVTEMTFFITSVGRGFGGNLGGLAGADNHCQRLAQNVGRGDHTWRAYLSAPATSSSPAIHARDRIGKGPWVNAAGVRVAADLRELHGADNRLGRETSLTEKGTAVAPGRHAFSLAAIPTARSRQVPRTRRARAGPATTPQAAQCSAITTRAAAAEGTPGTRRTSRAAAARMR